MGTPFTIEIPYDQLMLLVMGLFMFIGATRGVNREAVTSLGLFVLSALLVEPGLAGPIIGYLSKMVQLIMAFIASHFSVDLQTLMGTYSKIEVPFSRDNPYAFLIFALIAFVLLSYTSRGTKDANALSRLLGGLLGLFNGFLVISLFREYIVKYIQRRSPTVSALGPPAQVSVALKDLPPGGSLIGSNLQFVVVVLGVLAALLFLSSAFGVSLKTDKKSKKE